MQRPTTRLMERSNTMNRGKRTLEGEEEEQPERKRPASRKVGSCVCFVPLVRRYLVTVDLWMIDFLGFAVEALIECVIVEALKVDSLQKLCSSLEPILRRVVSEEVERALAKLGPARLNGRLIWKAKNSSYCLVSSSQRLIPMRWVGRPFKALCRDCFAVMFIASGIPKEERKQARTLEGGMVTWNSCFSRNFHDWEMDAVQNFILKLNKFGRIRGEEDKMVWKASKSGLFSVRSFYNALEVEGEVTFPSKIIWGSWAPTKAGKEGSFGEQLLFAFYGQFGKCKIKEPLKGRNALSKVLRIPS
ncbi:Calmodulin-binding protein 60 B [Vitis vinifera]|uniref:Calmodulin-binding protein 60 B n=1 Tax=Vitis vinifera TaxID=29760 RepID=A0A438D2Z8_VITVI|nr:Calmodulin-binding protein 60 B [Vitis vinifera]